MTQTGPGSEYLDQSSAPNAVTMSPRAQAELTGASVASQQASGAILAVQNIPVTGALALSGVPISSAHTPISLGGGGGAINLAQSFQGIISDVQAQQREALDRIQEQNVVAERTAQYMSNAAERMVTVASILAQGTNAPGASAMGTIPTTVIGGMHTTQSPKSAGGDVGTGAGTTTRKRHRAVQDAEEGAAAYEGARTRKRRGGGGGPEGGGDDEELDPVEAARQSGYKTGALGYRQGTKLSMGSIRDAVFHRGAKALDTYQPGGYTATDKSISLPGIGGDFQLPAGVVYDPDTGEPVEHDVASQFLRRRKMTTLGRNVLEKVAQAPSGSKLETLFGSLKGESAAAGAAGETTGLTAGLGAVADFAAPVAAGFAAFRTTTGIMRNQSQANQDWLNILGTGQRGAFAARAQSQLFEEKSLLDPFGMGSGQRQQLYQGLLGQGFRQGQGLGAAQDFGTSMYRQYGMSADETLSLLSTNAQHGQRDLTGLSEAIAAVSQTARDSNVAVGAARKQFEQLYGTISNITGASGGSAATAAGITNVLLGMGNQVASNVDIAGGLTSPTAALLVANQNGLTLAQSETMQATNPVQFTEANQKNLVQQLMIYYPNAPTVVTQQLQKMGLKDGSSFMPNDNRLQVIGSAIVSTSGGDPQQQMAAISRLTGQNFNGDLNAFMRYIAGVFVNPNGLSNAITAASAPTKGTSFSSKNNADQDRAADVYSTVGTQLGAQGVGGIPSQFQGADGKLADLTLGLTYKAAAIEYGRGKLPGTTTQTGVGVYGSTLSHSEYQDYEQTQVTQALGTQGHGSAAQAFMRASAATGYSSPYANWLLDQKDDSMRLIVTDSDKQQRQVTLTQAFDRYYDQIVDGSAIIANGTDKGQRVSDAAGGQVNMTNDDISAGQQAVAQAQKGGKGKNFVSSSDNTTVGKKKSQSDVNKLTGASGGGTTRVIVEPTDALAQYLRFIPVSGSRAAASTTGTSPATSGPSASQAPTN